MSDYSLLSDDKIEAALCSRLETERLQRNITQAELARQAGISVRTVRRMEKGEGISLATFIRVLKALRLEDRLEALLPPQEISPIQRVSKSTHVRERASGKRKTKKTTEPWQWGDQ